MGVGFWLILGLFARFVLGWTFKSCVIGGFEVFRAYFGPFRCNLGGFLGCVVLPGADLSVFGWFPGFGLGIWWDLCAFCLVG